MASGPSPTSVGNHIEVTSSAPGGVYFPRRLKFADASIRDDRIDESGLLAFAGNKIVLGEPGMGKSALMRELGRRLDIEPVTAVRFINSRNPAKLVPAGKPLLIDGLDEAMSRREGDAIDVILAQLEEADSPAFILSCRSREWQARSVTNLRHLYGADPNILTLEPFNRVEAGAYLLAQHPSVDANHVLDHLAAHSLEDLYSNPLTLGLMGRVAESDIQLPATRGVLFERVCTLIWPEYDRDRQDEGLAQLTQDGALDAAGAIAAGLLFAGAEAASAAGAGQVQQGDIRLAELETLPQAKAARAIFSSKLFHSVGALRGKFIHRVIAEFLGARWLARQALKPRSQRRLLAQLHGSGGVPASLRGLHAWLAYHSPAMAVRVIAEDPYGVLRYGEPSALTPHLADCLFDALCVLAADDPYFRAADWDSKTAAGLMIPALRSKIDATIGAAIGSAHLRSLLIEGLEGSPLAADLADTLKAIIFSRERFFHERASAAEALLPHRDRNWWQTTIALLTDEGGNDAPRLARQLIEHIDADVSDGLLVTTLFAEMGLTSCPLPRNNGRRVHIVRHYDRLLNAIPLVRLVCVLDLIVDYAELLGDGNWENASDVGDIVAHLLIRAIDEGAVGSAQAPAVWRWLGIIEQAHDYHHDINQKLAQRLATHDALRRAIQTHVLANDRRKDSLWVTELYLQRRLVPLKTQAADLVCALDRLAQGDTKDQALRQDWMDLVSIGWGPDGLHPDVRSAADAFLRGDKLLADFLRKLENPKRPAWEVKREKEAAKRILKRKVAFETARRQFGDVRDDLRAGKLGAIVPPAKCYLGLFHDLPSELPPGERLAEWLGPALRDEALVGFEAVLHRTDLPTASEIADGLARGMVYSYSYAIMAGLYERMRGGKGMADLSEPLKLAALLLCHDDHGWEIEDEKEAVRAVLEADVIATPEARQAFARLWIEPALAAGKEHVAGLYMLARDPEWQATGVALGADWLTDFPNVPASVEALLVDCLTFGGALDALRDVAEARATTEFRNLEHKLSWLAIDALVRFDAVLLDLDGIGARHPEFIWFLRDRLQFHWRGGMLPLTVAQAEWIIAEFREQWVYAVLQGTGSGNCNDYDATDFLRSLIGLIADDTSVEAGEALQRLSASPNDSYTNLIRHMAAEQRQKRAEENFLPVAPGELAALLDDKPPGNIEDLKALVLEEMDVARRKLVGDDLDLVVDFWTDNGIPRNENRCRDKLAAIIRPELAQYDIQQITEADMPKTKRADLAFAYRAMQLPVEVKGQWHNDVWNAASGQLDVQYLVDWRSEHRGIYCVLWFGDVRSKSGRRLKPPPDGLSIPTSAEEMCTMLITRIPEARRALIDVVVFDFSAGKS
ncbi:NACHT domain-containing protein [Xanthobacter autotrophicus]|uniref:NACHT domain-containing protein n=1 Tax=Xanthobacter autotrophicus TaxID=280 RepID=UPI00372C0730